MNWQRTVDQERSRLLQKGQLGDGPVVYWMSRDQRAHDNWALLYAQERALALHKDVIVVFCIDLDYPAANLRHFAFLLRGLEEVQCTLEKAAIGFHLLPGAPDIVLPAFFEELDPSLLVTDFDPLRKKRQWKKKILQRHHFPVYEVDAHNIVPCWHVSDKREYGAYTIRPKLKKLLPHFLTDFPPLLLHPFGDASWKKKTINVNALLERIKDTSIGEINTIAPGEDQAQTAYREFLTQRLVLYPANRNNPCLNGQSNLSPYFHFGQLSPQRVAWEVLQSSVDQDAKDVYLEELIIRRELSDNYCYYTPDYDQFSGFPDWAKKTLNEHRNDPRPYLADLKTLENRATGEQLWNGCQRDLAENGKLHGYLRMYWAKKILEWSGSPEEALANAIYLNDKYSLDGRDPNGYAGIAWSIGGVHDRAWADRPIFGKIRYMNQNGCKRKFNVQGYLQGLLYRNMVV
ncbi:MAG TPA: deoxyribodipyrimidine photo-lyase [Desulfobulbaceae bacterium]|nr:deoxyribodipyrimidine photo-lyase [Desulfobulbaceae bacterium]